MTFATQLSTLVNDTIVIRIDDLGNTGKGGARAMVARVPVVLGGLLNYTEPSTGPLEGGNLVTIVGTTLGSGSDVGNVTLGGRFATVVSQGVNFAVVQPAAAPVAGSVDIITQSLSRGYLPLLGGYRYNERTPP